MRRGAALLLLLLVAAQEEGSGQETSPQEEAAGGPALVPGRENHVHVEGGDVVIRYVHADYLSVKCGAGAEAALDDVTLGAACNETSVWRVSFAGCAPPRRSYAALLRRLRVALQPRGALALLLPPAPAPLRAAHLAGLRLENLTLAAASPRAPPPAPQPGLLDAQPALRRLVVRDVPVGRGVLPAAPGKLEALTLAGAGAVRVPAALLARLAALVAGPGVRLEGAAPALRVASLTLAPNETPPQWDMFPGLTTVSLTSWNATAPAAWAACDALVSLSLTRPAFESLPVGWLSACPALESLSVSYAGALRSLPAALLRGACAAGAAADDACPAPALTSLSLRYCALRTLPARLLEAAPNLRTLDLNHNALTTLPGGIFTGPRRLTTLNLAGNDLETSVYEVLRSLRSLRDLDLSRNRRLGDACPGGGALTSGESRLAELRDLGRLDLSYTAVTRICRDWRRLPRLLLLLLHATNITSLSFSDLEFSRAVAGARMELRHTPVRSIVYSAEEERRALAAPAAAVAVQLTEPLLCDCAMFRSVRAMRRRPAHVALEGALRCAGGRELARVPLDELLCPAPGLCPRAPAQCACRARERDGGARRWHVRATCERAGLRAVPPLRAPPGYDVEWDLRLAGNRIRVVDDLPPGLRMLDLRNCSVERASPAAAAALAGLDALRLAGNPLRCDCAAAAAPLLRALAALAARDPRALDAVTCAAGGGAVAAQPECAPAAAWRAQLAWSLGATLGVLAALGAGAGAALARPTRRARLKGLLLRWGWLPRGAPPAEDALRPYDVFVSFAHEDAMAARALAARLERGGLRLCLHSRDWAPGEYIDAQIAASVRSARRTLALVSRRWAASRWARVELREALAAGARDATPRLVLVLLEPERELRAAADAELRRCLASCTYLHVDHPRFWQRLREALPPPRPAPAPPAPPPDPQAGAAAAA